MACSGAEYSSFWEDSAQHNIYPTNTLRFFPGHQALVPSAVELLGGSFAPIQGPAHACNNAEVKAVDGHLLTFTSYRLQCFDSPLLLDVGANMGSFTLLAGVVETLQVHAFEPVPLVCEMNRRIMRLNNLTSRTTTHCVAAGRRAGRGTLVVPSAFSTGLSSMDSVAMRQIHGYSHVSPQFEEQADALRIEVPIVTLDSVALALPRVHFIKIDVEGNAAQVLLGSRDVIQHDLPDLLVEISVDEKEISTFIFAFRSHTVADQYVYSQLLAENGVFTGDFFFTADLDWAHGVSRCNFTEHERRYDQRQMSPSRPGLCAKAVTLLDKSCRSCSEDLLTYRQHDVECPVMQCQGGFGLAGFRYLSNETIFNLEQCTPVTK